MRAREGSFRPAPADWMQAGLVALALFALYAASAPRTVGMEDDSLFVLSSYFLGIEHPPGYPLFTLIGHLFTYLPVGSVAYRVHLASALFGALSGAAVWLCARSLVHGRLPAYLGGFGLGASPVFWSQSIIAEVYTLNTFLFLVLVFLGLRACPPSGPTPEPAGQRRLLYAMALVFGLSLSNHWPLMLLVAPAFAVLLWPLRGELLQRLAFLLWLVALGLLPYVWMVYRSWAALPISFNGPLETLPEIWFFLSRAGYAEIDQSVSASWLDRAKFLQFLGAQLFVQFAVAGTLLAGAGFALQWRLFGRRVAGFLAVAFLMPSVVLLLLLGFDYSSATKHIFHVYPLPAYAVGALWMGLGLAWLANRYNRSRGAAAAAGALVLALIAGVGARANVFTDHEWIARYARTVLKLLPQNAVVFGKGDPDLAPMAYFHLVENLRPDVTLYQPQGLVLGNRLFHPLRTDEDAAWRIIREMIGEQTVPVVATLEPFKDIAWRDRWLFYERDAGAADAARSPVEIPEDAVRFFEEAVAEARSPNAWVAFFQGELRRRYAALLAKSLPRDRLPDERRQRQLGVLAGDFYGALGIAEGLIGNEQGYSVGNVASFLDRARELTPSDVTKEHLSRYFYLRGVVRANMRDTAGAIGDFETAFAIWPRSDNAAVPSLESLYREAGDERALKALRDRLAQIARLKSRR